MCDRKEKQAQIAAAPKKKSFLPLAQISDSQAHFFSYRSGATELNFFVLKSEDGVVLADGQRHIAEADLVAGAR